VTRLSRKYVAVCCSVLQCVAVRCSMSQCVAVCCRVCVTLSQVCSTHLNVCLIFICDTWFVHTCDVTRSCACHASLARLHRTPKTVWRMWHIHIYDIFIYMTRHNHACDVTHSYKCDITLSRACSAHSILSVENVYNDFTICLPTEFLKSRIFAECPIYWGHLAKSRLMRNSVGSQIVKSL